MKGMILAAGLGKRMQAFSSTVPKSLLTVNGKTLIERRIESLHRAGITEIVINVHHLAEQIKNYLGDGKHLGVKIYFSEEKNLLDVAGGIYNALPLLGNAPFVVTSADIVTDFPIEKIQLPVNSLGHLVLVPNPSYHAHGDFSLENNKIIEKVDGGYTFGNVAVYHPDFFKTCPPGPYPLLPLLKQHIVQQMLTGEVYSGQWHNVNTPEELVTLNARLGAGM